MKKTIKMVGISAICALLAQPALADGSWRKSAEGVWKKHVSANQATLRLALIGKQTFFAVTIPCSKKDSRTEATYRWTTGEAVAKSKEPCADLKPTIEAKQIMDLFLPLPVDYNPLRKERMDEGGLII